MADSVVLHKSTWQHVEMYSSRGQPAVYDDLSIPLFVNGYLAMVETEKEASGHS